MRLKLHAEKSQFIFVIEKAFRNQNYLDTDAREILSGSTLLLFLPYFNSV